MLSASVEDYAFILIVALVLFVGLVVVVALVLTAVLAVRPTRRGAAWSKRATLLGLRALVIVMVVLAMLRPTLVYTKTRKQSATVIVLADQGYISLEAGIALALGSNIGTCVTAVLAALGKPAAARQAVAAHVLFNVVGVLIWTPFLPELAEFVPAFDTAKLVRGWAGLYAVNTLDGNAILGEWPELKGLFLANGFSGHGLQQAPAVARYISELILGQPPTLDLSIFGPERILEKRPLSEGGLV